MTPRVGVKTTLTMEARHSGLLFPSKGPTFLPAFCLKKWDSHFWLSSLIQISPEIVRAN